MGLALPRASVFLATLAVTAALFSGAQGFIRVQNGVFVDDQCKEFTFSGYNTWQPIESALNLCCGGYEALVGQFKEAARQNFTVVRMFGFPVQRGFNLQTAAGVYNEQAFKGMDTVIAEAARNNVKLVIAFMNNWNYNPLQTDWKCSYTNWTTTALGCDDFYTDPNSIKLYKNHVRTMLTRVNTVTGLEYGSDPTIMAWNLMNEPRNEKPNGAQEIQSWITEVAPYVKSLAPNQLVTVGEDGFYQPATCQANQANPVATTNGGPGGAWPVATGNDYLPNHMADGIDYASIHMWPDNWGRTDKAFGQTWLAAHIADTKYLGKPLVLEEFGKAVGGYLPIDKQEGPEAQYAYYKQTYDAAQASLQANTGLKGIMFWRWAGVDPTAKLADFDEAATIASNSSVFTEIIQPFTSALARKNADPTRAAVTGCTPVTGAPTTTTAKTAASAALPPSTAVPPTSGATAAGSGATATGAAAGGRRLMQGTAPAPAAAGAVSQNFVGKSTFTTPAGITAANINSKVTC
ncbi:glycoside hydrolase [Coccomyxa subellipsoidea C-169]|uniref:mannan endo-1,4-beta-mannosidase n=1 Tax=Coccomyxa subellipsoidea (strain C-169) TaxID=574566 RepID=I0ZAS8_COCSC|nr:glycoside hydrolase [Coccomyxa subellipsoidea C-169]EIE27747.1 glycoside hydrolase [Coccomyxa subellipsoidea C-169]|eukprot:XP_005652291.1 glycoside hydrolase [Coccomyxa subellipsoidea C-169]